MDIYNTLNQVFEIEINSLLKVKNQINDQFVKAVELIHHSKGKVIVSGMGKSGLIGGKISATLSSTGTTSVFMHPGEAIHGDLGIVREEDILILISYSGETDEILKLIPSLNRMNVPIIGITGNPTSTLALNATAFINAEIETEACPLDLAPTSSTTAALVVGDAIAVALMKLKNFKVSDFAVFHPGGSLGRKLLCKVKDEMKSTDLPTIHKEATIQDVIISISKGMLGLSVVTNDSNHVVGIITDGDLRKAMHINGDAIFKLKAQDIMTLQPKTIDENLLIGEAEAMMKEKNVNALLILENMSLKGILCQRHIL